MTRLGLVTRLSWDSLVAERRTSTLAALLVALPIAPLVLASTPDSHAISAVAAPVVSVLVWVALTSVESTRTQYAAHLWLNGGRRGTRVGIVAAQASILGLSGSTIGALIGYILRIAIAAPATVGWGSNEGIALAGFLAGAGGTLVVIALASLRSLRAPSLPALSGRVPAARVRWWWLAICTFVLLASTWRVAGAQSFWDLDFLLIFLSPLFAIATVGLASAAPALLGIGKAWTTGPVWFAMRSVSRDRRRTGPLVGLAAVLLTICMIGAVMSRSFLARVEVAQRALDHREAPTWFNSIEFDECISDRVAVGATRATSHVDCAELGPDARTLAASGFVMRKNLSVWALTGGAATAAIAMLGVAIALGASARRTDDEVLDLEGATADWRRRANAWEAGLISATGAVTAVFISCATTAFGFAVYNRISRVVTHPARPENGYRGAPTQIFPKISFVMPWDVAAALLIGLPLFLAATAWLLTRPASPTTRSRRSEAATVIC